MYLGSPSIGLPRLAEARCIDAFLTISATELLASSCVVDMT